MGMHRFQKLFFLSMGRWGFARRTGELVPSARHDARGNLAVQAPENRLYKIFPECLPARTKSFFVNFRN